MRPLTLREREALDRLLRRRFPQPDGRDHVGIRMLAGAVALVMTIGLGILFWGGLRWPK